MNDKPFELGSIKPIDKIGIQDRKRKVIRESKGVELDSKKHSLACPNCKTVLDGAGGYSISDKDEEAGDGQHKHQNQKEDAKPRPGCPSVCISCGQLLMYDGTVQHLLLREMTTEEWNDIKKECPQAANILGTARHFALQRASGKPFDEIKENMDKQSLTPKFWR